MAEHHIPQKLIDVVLADLNWRVAEGEEWIVDGIDEAIVALKGLPSIADGLELEIEWYAQLPPASAVMTLSADRLELTIGDEDGFREVYRCDAGSHPRTDSDLSAWLTYFRSLGGADLAISCYVPKSLAETPPASELSRSEIALAQQVHENFRSYVTLQFPGGGALRIHVYDTGRAPMAAFGSDFDRWVENGPEAKDQLLVELLREKYAGDVDAVTHFREFCEARDVPHRYDIY